MTPRIAPTIALRAGRLSDLTPGRIEALASDLATLAGPAGFAITPQDAHPWLTLAVGDDGEPLDFTLTTPAPADGEDWVRVAARLAACVTEGLTLHATPAPTRWPSTLAADGRSAAPTVVDVLDAALARLGVVEDLDLGQLLDTATGAIELTGRILMRSAPADRSDLAQRLLPHAAGLARRALALTPTPTRRDLEAATGWLVDAVEPGDPTAPLVAGLPGGGRWFAVAGVTDLAAVRSREQAVRTFTLDRAPTRWWVSPSPGVGRFLRQACARAHAGSLW